MTSQQSTTTSDSSAEGPKPARLRPAFLITIDTEGDDLWSRPREITTRNAAVLPPFQQLCEKYGLKATYLSNWEMVNSAEFQEFGCDVLRRGAGEIGMHLHAWNSPPLSALTADDFAYQPYLIEYHDSQIHEKVKVLTDKLEDTFGVRMYSHRAGRWGFNEVYARVLLERGYRVDCSVTPHVSWQSHPGDPAGQGGTDYRAFPESAYFIDVQDIGRSGDSRLLEIPMTIIKREGSALVNGTRRVLERLPLGRRVSQRLFPRHWWLRPNGHNQKRLLRILSIACEHGRDYIEFMLHSSELMPGGSSNFATAAAIGALYDDMEVLFSAARRDFVGLTLKEYHDRFRTKTAGCREAR